MLASCKALLRRKRRAWERRSSEGLCQLAAIEPSKFWRKYRKREDAARGISIEAWHEAFSTLLAPEAPAIPLAAPIMGAGMRQAQGSSSDHLSEPISTREVASALKKLRRNKAAGVDGIRAEHLFHAQAMLLQPMTVACTHLLLVEIPDCLCRGVIHPIFKAGERADPSNYRGITVTPVLFKLFAMVLEARLSIWAEIRGIRAHGQAGFRKGHMTVDHVFTLRALVTQAKQRERKLFCCFVGFKKAFDSIPWKRLWQVLVGRAPVMFNACKACMLTIVLASSRKMAARTSSHAQQVSNRVVQLALSYLAYFLMHLRATW